MNDIQVVLRGNLASEPRSVRFDDGNSLTTFRLASTSSWFDREHNTWIDRSTTYVSVNCRRALAAGALQSLQKGHPVVVTGRLWERAWTKDERSGHSLEVEAETVGHDLTFGVCAFTRVPRAGRERHVRHGGGETLRPPSVDGPTPEETAMYEAVRGISAVTTDVSSLAVLDGDPSESAAQVPVDTSATRGG